MAPHPKRTITVLEAHPHSTALPLSNGHSRPDNGMMGPSPAPQTAKQSAATTTTRTNAPSPSRSRRQRSTRRGVSSTTAASKPTTTLKATRNLTVTSYSSTTTIYTTSSSGFATSTRPEATSTIAGPPIHRTHVVSSSYNIPDPPAWFPFVLGILLAVMLSLAVLFYCVNFPSKCSKSAILGRYHAWRARVAERRKRYGYQKVDADEVEDDDESRSDTSPELATAVTTSASTPGLHNTPTLYSRRRKVGDMRLQEGAGGAGAGLGITFDVGQKSFDETLLRPDVDKAHPLPPHTAALLRPRTNSTDLEAGLLRPPAHDRRRPIHPDPVLHSAPAPPLPSPGIRVLEMVGGSVEYAAEKMSRFMHDSVRGDPEEGLLLPVRDCERENRER